MRPEPCPALSLALSLALSPALPCPAPSPALLRGHLLTGPRAALRRPCRTVFYHVVSQLEGRLQRHCARRDALSPALMVAAALYFLATGASYRSVAHTVGISRASVCIAVKEVCAGNCEEMSGWVRFPDSAGRARVNADVFQAWGAHSNSARGAPGTPGLPQVIGAIGAMRVPLGGAAQPVCVLQAVCDHEMRFMDLCAGTWPGGVHDAEVLERSGLGCALRDPASPLRRLLDAGAQLESGRVGSARVPFMLVGHSAYPLGAHVLPAFPDSELRLDAGPGRAYFNDKHEATRSVIERAFGVLKARFGVLQVRGGFSRHKPELVVLAVGACFILHNVCLEDARVLGPRLDAAAAAPDPMRDADDDARDGGGG